MKNLKKLLLFYSLMFMLLFPSFTYAKKFKVKKGDLIQGAFLVGIDIPFEKAIKKKDWSKLKKEKIQIYPVSIMLLDDQFRNCNAIGNLIFNPSLLRFYGAIYKISCNENGKIKDYKTKGYILNGDKTLGMPPFGVKPKIQTYIMIVDDIKQ